MSVTPKPTTNGGVTIGRMEKMRPITALRLAMRVVYIASTRPKKVQPIPTAIDKTIELTIT